MGVWRSDDGGDTWQRVLYDENFGATHSTVLAVHPSDPNTVAIGDLHGNITRTTNGGGWWQIVYEGEVSVFALAFAPSQPSILYAGDSEGKLLKSINSGASWSVHAQLTNGGIGSLVVDPGNADTVYVGARDGVYKSTDGGKTWNRVHSSQEVVEVAVAPTDPRMLLAATVRGVYLSTDAGDNWAMTLDHHAHSVQASPDNPQVAYAGTRDGIYRSDDGGRTWSLENNGIQFLDIGPLAVHPEDIDTVLVGNNIWQWTYHYDPYPASTAGEGIYKTADGGATWTKSTAGFVDVDVIALTIDPNNANVVYVGTECSRGIFRSDNGGGSWIFIAGGPESGSWDIAHYTMRLATDPGSNLLLTGRFGLAISSDLGQSWTSNLPRRHFHGVGISPHDPQLIFAGTSPVQDPTESETYPGARILRSRDGGRSWQEVGEGFPSGIHTSVHDFAFDPVDPNVVYMTTSSHEIGLPRTSTTVGIYKSMDGGLTWTSANNGLANLNVDVIMASPTTSGLLYAGTESGVFHSTDGGAVWKKTSLVLPVRSLLIDPIESETIYAGSDRGLYWSPDGGTTWQQIDSVPANAITSIAMDPDGKFLYAAVNDVGIFKGERR